MALKWERFPDERFKYKWSSRYGTTTSAQPLDRSWKGHQPLWLFDLLISAFYISKDFKLFWAAPYKNESNLLLVQITVCNRILFFILAGALLFVEKIRQRAALYWFRLRDVGILHIFNSRALIQRTIVDFPAFLKHGPAEKMAVCAHTNSDQNKQDGFIFVWRGPEIWNILKNSKLK